MPLDREFVAVVDDEEPIRKALRRLLTSAGWEVATFASGVDFLRSLRDDVPACVVLDIRMDGMTGFDVHARLKKDAVNVPVVFITALDDPGDIDRAMQAGAVTLLRKPFGDDELLAAIDAAVHSKGTAEQAGRRTCDFPPAG